jgi:hypothetical protein
LLRLAREAQPDCPGRRLAYAVYVYETSSVYAVYVYETSSVYAVYVYETFCDYAVYVYEGGFVDRRGFVDRGGGFVDRGDSARLAARSTANRLRNPSRRQR